MTTVIFTILPVFAVVFAGWAVARVNLISAEGINGFNNVTFYLFVPALLLRGDAQRSSGRVGPAAALRVALRWPLPDAVDAPLALLAAASGPCSLVLPGASIAQYGIAELWRAAAVLTVLKNNRVSAFIWAFARSVFGIGGVPLAVITVTAALPMGANLFLFAQRYQVAQGEISAAVTISIAASVLTLTLAMLNFGW